MNINATLIAQIVTFLIFVWFNMKFVWPPISKALEERRAKIAEGLAASDRAQKDLELAQQKAAEVIREAREQASEIVEQANQRANQILDHAKEEAVQERERQMAAALAEIELEVNRAKEDLRKQVASLAVEGAEKLLQREIDAAAHKDLLDALAAEI